MCLKMIILREANQTKTNIWYHLHVESKKKMIDELVYKTETDSQTYRKHSYQKGKEGRNKLGVWG